MLPCADQGGVRAGRLHLFERMFQGVALGEAGARQLECAPNEEGMQQLADLDAVGRRVEFAEGMVQMTLDHSASKPERIGELVLAGHILSPHGLRAPTDKPAPR